MIRVSLYFANLLTSTRSRSPPNMTRILYRWGLQPLLDRVAHKCKSMLFRKGESSEHDLKKMSLIIARTPAVSYVGSTGEHIGAINFDKDFLLDLVADFLLIQVCISLLFIISLISTYAHPFRGLGPRTEGPATTTCVRRRRRYFVFNDGRQRSHLTRFGYHQPGQRRNPKRRFHRVCRWLR